MRWLLPFALSCELFAQAAPTYRLPAHGFLPSAPGDPEAIFTTRDFVIGEASILNGRFDANGPFRFIGTAYTSPIFSEPLPTPVNLYLGGPSQWRHLQTTYARARMGEWYAGVSAQWLMAGETAILQLGIAAGVDPSIVRISNFGCRAPSIEVTCLAYQTEASGLRKTLVPRFEGSRDRPNSLTFESAPSPGEPITVEFHFLNNNHNVPDAKFASDGSLFLLHDEGFVKFDARGTPLFETRFRGLIGSRLSLSETQSVIVTGRRGPFNGRRPDWPLLPGSADSFVAQFDQRGQLVGGLYGPGRLSVALAKHGEIVLGRVALSGHSVVGRWVPGRSSLENERQVPGAIFELAIDAAGDITCLLMPVPGVSRSTDATAGALDRLYLGRHQLFATKLTSDLSRVVWATFLPMLPDPIGMDGALGISGVQLDPTGELLVAATARYRFTVAGRWEGTANVLHRLAADGSHYVYSESLPGPAISLSLHQDGSVWFHGRTPKDNLPTSLQAPLRGACNTELDSYVASRSRTGQLLQASYLRGVAPITISPSGRFVYQWRRADPPAGEFTPVALSTAGSTPAFACPPSAAPGAIVTVYGQGLGPVVTQTATPVDGRWPFQLAGVRLTIGGQIAGLIVVQHGFVKFQAPVGLPTQGSLPIVVEYNSNVLEGNALLGSHRATLITTDGSTFGPLAAVHADGSLNSPSNPAKRASIVTLFATGLDAGNWRVEFSPFGEARTLYRGPAPGLPGVTQFNVEIPFTASQQAAVGLTLRTIAPPNPLNINVSNPKTTIEIEP